MSKLSTNVEAFLRSRRAKRLKESTIEWYDWLLSSYRECVESEGLQWDSPDALDVFFGDHLPTEELSKHTIHGYYRALRCFFNWLERRHRLPGYNPIKVFDAPKVPRAFPRDVPQEDVEKLLATIGVESYQDRRDRAIILFLWDTGVRASELCGLELSDLDLERKQAIIRNGKGEKDRKVSFGDQAVELLEEWFEVREEQASCSKVFLSRDGDSLTSQGLRSMLYRRGERVGVEGPCNPHAFRHGFAMAFLENGGDIHNLQHLMGHLTLRSTEPYLNATDKRAAEDHAKVSPGDHLTI